MAFIYRSIVFSLCSAFMVFTMYFSALMFEWPCSVFEIFKPDFAAIYREKIETLKQDGMILLDFRPLSDQFETVCLTSKRGGGFGNQLVWPDPQFSSNFSSDKIKGVIGKTPCWGYHPGIVTAILRSKKNKILHIKINTEKYYINHVVEHDYDYVKIDNSGGSLSYCSPLHLAVAHCVETGDRTCALLFKRTN